jgi:methyl-accepting chemotaxis protein
MNIGKSIIWRLVVPIPVVTIIGLAIIWATLPGMVADDARDTAVNNAVRTANQFKTIRGYYTKNVIAKAVKTGALKPSVNHADEPGSIPLPATLIHDLSALLAEADTTINLFSEFPFPGRSTRRLDDFQTAAWAFLQSNPDDVFARRETRDGREIVRVGVADRMVAKGCVDCHNSVAGSPKTDWRLGDVRGVLEVATVIDGPLAQGTALSNRMLIGAAVTALLLLALTVLVARSVANPIGRMTRAMQRIADGEESVEIPARGRSDEIGSMAETLEVFRAGIVERERLQSEKGGSELRAQEEESRHERARLEAQAEAERREADARIQAERRQAMRELADTFERSVGGVIDGLSGAAEQMQSSARVMSSAAEATNQQSAAVAVASDDASANVQTVASAAEELAASVQEVSRQAAQSATISSAAVKETQRTNDRIAGLAEAGQRIGEVVTLINDIASQTNLLALNASIEAARAGDAGKGFAVVANEVKSLADQTARATEEIASQINAIQDSTTDAVEAIQSISATITEINDIATGITAAVDEQGAATREIAESASHASTGTHEVSAKIAHVTDGTAKTGGAAEQVAAAANELTAQSEVLRRTVDEFLEWVREA